MILFGLIGVVLALLLAVPFMIYHGWVVSYLWLWFVVPTFNLPELSVAQSIGLMLLVGVFKTKDNTKSEIDIEKAVWSLLIPLITLSFGYVLKFWWMA